MAQEVGLSSKTPRVDAAVDGNRITASLKYPKGLNKKWDEREAYVACGECGSESITSSQGEARIILTCDECANWDVAETNWVCQYREYSRGRQEAQVYTSQFDYFERIERP